MNIGVLTYHFVPNFGAQLQTMSTIGFIKKTGHNPILLHWHPKDFEQLYTGRVPESQLICQKNFAQNNFPLSSLCENEEDLVKEIERNNLGLIITGSDALFKYMPLSERTFFSKRKLKFVKRKVFSFEEIDSNPFFCTYYEKLENKIPVVAFSVSSQNCDYCRMSNKELLIMRDSLNNFRYISTRDEWTKRMVEYVTRKNYIEITPDPVFAFNYNCYVNIPTKDEIREKYNLPENYVLISFWTNTISPSYVEELSAELISNNLTPVAFPMPEGLLSYGIKCTVNLPLSPIDWYAIIIHSKGYIGERMHPIIVCLHNSVPFFVFDEYGIEKKYLGGLYKKYIKDSSKTYHIVTKAGVANNLYSYKSREAFPSTKEVVYRLLSFDIKKCSLFSNNQYIEYLDTMQKILKY